MNKLLSRFFLAISLLFLTHSLLAAVPTIEDVNAKLKAAKEDKSGAPDIKLLIQNLEDNLSLLNQIEDQKNVNKQLENDIAAAPKKTENFQQDLLKLKASENKSATNNFANEKLPDLQAKLTNKQKELEDVQKQLNDVGAKKVAQETVPETSQSTLTENLARIQQINKLFYSSQVSPSLRQKYETELALIELVNNYNQTLLTGNERLVELYNAQFEYLKLYQASVQAEVTSLQDAINNKHLQESKSQVEQAAQAEQLEQQKVSEGGNPAIANEATFNTKLSESLVNQITEMNTLSQDNLRIKNVLDNLQQTKRNIDEQISALQGTLVLSRIINKQKQALPQDQVIKGLSKRITDLRVKIFDLTEFRDVVNDIDSYIQDIEKKDKVTFTDKEKEQLTKILQERSKIISDLLKSLNNQLNLSINIELNQQQVISISDELQSKLQQQSFWVKSNSPMDLAWVEGFPRSATFQISEIMMKIDLSNWRDNLIPAASLILLLWAVIGIIHWRKPYIKQRLLEINNNIKSLSSDNQWHTPIAVFWTLILSLSSTFAFLSLAIFIIYICFQNPIEIWPWALKMSGYWLFFTVMLAMLRPNGIFSNHFNKPMETNQVFRQVLKRSVWVIALLLNCSILTKLEKTGIVNDVIGQLTTIIVLIITLFMIGPRLRNAVARYQIASKNEPDTKAYLLTLVRIILFLAPIALIILIVMGYYYTTLNLIEHFMLSYFVTMIWIVIRNMSYRSLTVSAKRLAVRRLRERREKKQVEKSENIVDEVVDVQKEETIALKEVRSQMQSILDFVLWIALFGLFYWVWSDLITVAYYLEGVTLWQQTVTTEKGIVTESITLLNVLLAIIILAVTYGLIKNIAGLLEVTVFSRLKLSQGAPYTITTLLTYFIIAIGGSMAFSTLGMSWSKLQWLFAALSVGLGFGLQEIFANFVSGIIILFERPVRINDVITIGQFSGTVSKIRIRATTLIDFDGKEVIVPNKAFVTERLTNWALSNTVTRIVVKVGVGYGADLDLTKKLLLQAASESDRVLRDPAPSVYFLTFGASTLDHELRVYVGQLNERNMTVDFLNRRIYQLFNENGIEIAFNQLDVFIKNSNSGEEVKIIENKNMAEQN